MVRAYGKLVRLLGTCVLAAVLAVTAVQTTEAATGFLGYCGWSTPVVGVPQTCGGWCVIFTGPCGTSINSAGTVVCGC